ncbi:MAG: polyketide synthase [Kiritimatiellae bacterium]|nr:polyketide synthase [Kiritimatiellia bacterium]
MECSISIVGMSCRFAGCPSPDALWAAVMARRSNLAPLPPDLALPVGRKGVFARPYPSRLGQLGDLYSCVPSMQTFPRQVNAGENQDLYFATQLAFDALADASMRPRSRTPLEGSVRLGYAPPFNASTMNWLQHTEFLDQTMEVIRRFFPHAPPERLDGVREKLVESLPVPDASSFLLGTGYRFASWISRECAFAGVSSIMDAGMLTGAATVDAAVCDLVCGNADIALAGAVTPPVSRSYLEGLSGGVPFSERPELRPFSAVQDGTIPGEGGAFFVLKRRADALRDRDRIYANIRAVAIGRTVDTETGHVLGKAAEKARVDPTTIGLVEADGSGIGQSESREVAALQQIWGEHRPGRPLVGIGSVKGNIGHTLRAAMAAGMAKAAMALKYRILPPQVAVENPLAALSSASSSVYLLCEARPWVSGDSSRPRRAAVLGSNFDASERVEASARGGRAAAILLEEEPETRE